MKLIQGFSWLLLLVKGAQVIAECETAFAKCDSISPVCFIGDSELTSSTNRWGWRHGPIIGQVGTITCELWAGANACDTSDADRKAGTVTITSKGFAISLEGWEFNPDSGEVVHFYQGSTPYPVVNGERTTAPGQYSAAYPRSPDVAPGTWNYVKGDILKPGEYFILHASVCSRAQNIIESKPTKTPTVAPSPSPSKTPTKSPTATPSVSPSMPPTMSPTATPSASPSIPPTATPSASPSISPTASPSAFPSMPPTAIPSSSPSMPPTMSPSVAPSASPSRKPTKSPTAPPSKKPTPRPSPSPIAAPVSLDCGETAFAYCEGKSTCFTFDRWGWHTKVGNSLPSPASFIRCELYAGASDCVVPTAKGRKVGDVKIYQNRFEITSSATLSSVHFYHGLTEYPQTKTSSGALVDTVAPGKYSKTSYSGTGTFFIDGKVSTALQSREWFILHAEVCTRRS